MSTIDPGADRCHTLIEEEEKMKKNPLDGCTDRQSSGLERVLFHSYKMTQKLSQL
jgi:hypothetical protein